MVDIVSVILGDSYRTSQSIDVRRTYTVVMIDECTKCKYSNDGQKLGGKYGEGLKQNTNCTYFITNFKGTKMVKFKRSWLTILISTFLNIAGPERREAQAMSIEYKDKIKTLRSWLIGQYVWLKKVHDVKRHLKS